MPTPVGHRVTSQTFGFDALAALLGQLGRSIHLRLNQMALFYQLTRSHHAFEPLVEISKRFAVIACRCGREADYESIGVCVQNALGRFGKAAMAFIDN